MITDITAPIPYLAAMAKRIALTGNIGSGKTTVARLFQELGIPVFEADAVAKQLLVEDADLRRSVTAHFGPNAYDEQGDLNRAYLAKRIFSSEEDLNQLNALVHPAVTKAALTWHESQADAQAKLENNQFWYTLHEAAITLEIGQANAFDAIIVVTAPESVRLQRVMRRDGSTEAQVLARMARQWPEAQKVAAADYLIYNDGQHELWPQVESVHQQIKALP
ncbi:MAG: dephospho-CoA kinase [Bacteroidota bacterium]